MGWRYNGRLWFGTDLQLAKRAPPSFSLAFGYWLERCLLDFARHQPLWRSTALDDSEIRRLHRALISEHYEVSAIVVVSSNDARPRHARVMGTRCRDATMAASIADLWQ